MLQDLLLQCFNKDPQQRPDARTLLRHPWIQFNRQTLRTSWSKTQGGQRLEAVYSGPCLAGCRLSCMQGCCALPLGLHAVSEQPMTWHCAVRQACCAGLYAPSPCAGIKARGGRTDAHESVNSVVERMLAAETEDSTTSSEQLPSLQPAISPTGQSSRPRSAGGPLLLARQQYPSCSVQALCSASASACHPVHGRLNILSVFP